MTCETCKILEDLIKEIRPDKIIYDQYTPLVIAMEKVLKRHQERVHSS